MYTVFVADDDDDDGDDDVCFFHLTLVPGHTDNVKRVAIPLKQLGLNNGWVHHFCDSNRHAYFGLVTIVPLFSRIAKGVLCDVYQKMMLRIHVPLIDRSRQV